MGVIVNTKWHINVEGCKSVSAKYPWIRDGKVIRTGSAIGIVMIPVSVRVMQVWIPPCYFGCHGRLQNHVSKCDGSGLVESQGRWLAA